MSRRIIYNFLNDDELLRISKKIKDSEKVTSAEIVVSIKEQRRFWEFKKTIRDLAEKEFRNAGISNTVDKTGVLIFIILSEKRFYILADKKVSEKIDQIFFESLADEMSAQFKSGNFSSGIINCINKLTTILAEIFPVQTNDANELSDKVLIR